jgi:peptide deformylase
LRTLTKITCWNQAFNSRVGVVRPEQVQCVVSNSNLYSFLDLGGSSFEQIIIHSCDNMMGIVFYSQINSFSVTSILITAWSDECM